MNRFLRETGDNNIILFKLFIWYTVTVGLYFCQFLKKFE